MNSTVEDEVALIAKEYGEIKNRIELSRYNLSPDAHNQRVDWGYEKSALYISAIHKLIHGMQCDLCYCQVYLSSMDDFGFELSFVNSEILTSLKKYFGNWLSINDGSFCHFVYDNNRNSFAFYRISNVTPFLKISVGDMNYLKFLVEELKLTPVNSNKAQKIAVFERWISQLKSSPY